MYLQNRTNEIGYIHRQMKQVLIIFFILSATISQAGVNASEVLKSAIRNVLKQQSQVRDEIGAANLHHIDVMRWLDTLTHYDDDLVYTYRPADRSMGDSIKCYSELSTYKAGSFVHKIELFFPASEFTNFKRVLDTDYLPEKGLDMLWLEKWNKRPSATYNRRSIHLTKDNNVLKVTCTLYTIII
jgi:hypothetical protein